MSEGKFYIGDGVYLARVPYGWRLTTENGVETTNEIYLEPEVATALMQKIAEELELWSRA